jgi:DNA (cytosine-5)-methyltransferase 1
MRHGSLFSGIGGFDLAAQWMGWENVFHCEWNPFGQKVLHHYWPNAEQFTDITKSDFKKYHGTVDIISGGFPCQPYSMAGKRLGKEDDRHLWPEMLRVIREVQPKWVVGENVFGLVNWSGGLVFHEVQTDLEAAGYEVFPYVLPAAAVNAPHRRDRIWFVAYSHSISNRRKSEQSRNTCEQGRCSETDSGIGNEGEQQSLCNIAISGDATNSEGINANGFTGNGDSREFINKEKRETIRGEFGNIGKPGIVTDTSSIGFQREREPTRVGRERFSVNDAQSNKSTWENFPTQSPICNGDDGISTGLDGITFSKWRNESIKAGGNAIVPNVVFQIFKAIEQYELLTAPATDTRQ